MHPMHTLNLREGWKRYYTRSDDYSPVIKSLVSKNIRMHDKEAGMTVAAAGERMEQKGDGQNGESRNPRPMSSANVIVLSVYVVRRMVNTNVRSN